MLTSTTTSTTTNRAVSALHARSHVPKIEQKNFFFKIRNFLFWRLHTVALYVTQASARSPSGLISLPVSVMPSKNNERLKNKLTAVNIPLKQRTTPWLIVTKERIQNAMHPKNMNRPEGLNKFQISRDVPNTGRRWQVFKRSATQSFTSIHVLPFEE